MTVGFMTEAGRKTGDSTIDRLALEYEQRYGIPLNDRQIRLIDRSIDLPEYGGPAYMQSLPFSDPDRMRKINERRNLLTLDNLGIKPGGDLPGADLPIFGGPAPLPDPRDRPRLPQVIDEARRSPPIFKPPFRRDPPLPRLPPIFGGPTRPRDPRPQPRMGGMDDISNYLNRESPYEGIGDYLLNRPVFDRGQRTDDPMSMFRYRDRLGEGLDSMRGQRQMFQDRLRELQSRFDTARTDAQTERQSMLDRIAELEGRPTQEPVDIDALRDSIRQEILAEMAGQTPASTTPEQPVTPPTTAPVNVSDGRADELGLFDVGNEMGQGGMYDRMAPPNIEELREIVMGSDAIPRRESTPPPMTPPDPSRLAGMVMGVRQPPPPPDPSRLDNMVMGVRQPDNNRLQEMIDALAGRSSEAAPPPLNRDLAEALSRIRVGIGGSM